MTLLLIYLFIAIGVSFLCSILEAVLLSVTPGYVESQLAAKPRRAGALKGVRENLDQSISSILILNTFAHTMGAAGVGAQALRVFGAQYESLIAFLLTLAILYFSEIIPKTLGATYWKQFAIPSAYVIRVLVKILYPFVWLSGLLTSTFSGDKSGGISRDELAALARLGRRHGALGPKESELLENLLTLRHTRTGEIITPRTVVTALDGSKSLSDAILELEKLPYTRIPIYRSSIDNVSGLILKPQILEAAIGGGGDDKLQDHCLPIFRVSEELPVLQLLDQFIKRKEHMFLVEDEYGQTAGIVTLEDAIETLLGQEIMDESDTVEDLQQLARSKYRHRLREGKDD
jgi:magnesium and cobalt exporter, CNNM family